MDDDAPGANRTSEEPPEVQRDEVEDAFAEFEQQLAAERAELERLRQRVAELENAEQQSTVGLDGGRASDAREPDVTEREGGTGPEIVAGSEPTESIEPTEPVILVSATETVTEQPAELPPRSTHPLYRRIWGRDLDGEQPGQHWIHKPIGS